MSTLRIFRRSPWYSLWVIVILALGVGASTAIFTLVTGVLWSQLPYHAAERLVSVWSSRTDREKAPLSIADFKDFSSRTKTLMDVAVFAATGANLSGIGEPERLQVVRTTANLFHVLGVEAVRGRVLGPDDDAPGAAKVAVMSYGLWQRRFGGSSGLVGTRLLLNDESYLIIGILPKGYFFPIREADLAVPLEPETNPRRLDRGDHFLTAVARLKEGIEADAAQKDLTSIARELQRQYPMTNAKNNGVRVAGLAEEITGNVRRGLMVLAAAVVVLLLMVSSSLVNLSLARASGRRQELAIRSALGAGRGHLIGLLLKESLALAVAGAAAGLLVAYGGLSALIAFRPADLPMLATIHIGGRGLAWNFMVALAAALCFGVGPALSSSRIDLSARGIVSERRSGQVRRVLSAAQVACSLVLLIAAGLLFQSFLRLETVNPGFEPGGALVLRLSLGPASFPTSESIARFCLQLRRQIEVLPGVEAAGAVSVLPMSGILARLDFVPEGHTPASPDDVPSANYRVIGPGYLRAMRIRLLRGRDLEEGDTSGTRRVALANESLARRFWPAGDAVGKSLNLDGDDKGPVEIVGVAADVRQVSLEGPAGPDIYVPYTQAPQSTAGGLRNNMFWVVRPSGKGAAPAAAIRRLVLAMDKEVAIAGSSSLDRYLGTTLIARRFNVSLLGLFSLCALLLAAVAIYGVLAYSVSQRTREMGLRLAIGAQRGEVLRLVAGEGLRLTLGGLAAGLVFAVFAVRPLQDLLYGIGALDLRTFLLVAATVLLTGWGAAWIPALRATRVDPVVTLRQE
jgi:putative ABC transport system permease protein